MSINEKTLKNLIKKNNLVGTADLENSTKVAKHLGCSIVDVLIGRDILHEEVDHPTGV